MEAIAGIRVDIHKISLSSFVAESDIPGKKRKKMIRKEKRCDQKKLKERNLKINRKKILITQNLVPK